MSDQPIVFEEWKTADGELIAVARLNTPRNLNSLSMDMISLLKPQLSRWAEDPKVQAVWLEAEGDKAFCAGGDIVSLYRAMTEPGNWRRASASLTRNMSWITRSTPTRSPSFAGATAS